MRAQCNKNGNKVYTALTKGGPPRLGAMYLVHLELVPFTSNLYHPSADEGNEGARIRRGGNPALLSDAMDPNARAKCYWLRGGTSNLPSVGAMLVSVGLCCPASLDHVGSRQLCQQKTREGAPISARLCRLFHRGPGPWRQATQAAVPTEDSFTHGPVGRPASLFGC